MTAAPDLRRLPDGRWLLRRDARRWVLPGPVGERLREQDGAGDILKLLDASASPARRSGAGPRPRIVLLPARAVDACARRLAPLAAWPVLAASGLGGGAVLFGGAWSVAAAGASWPGAAAVLLGVLVGHELGHAAALRRGGGRAGAVGAGLLAVMPTLWCDVSEAGLLPRGDRVRVDLAGVAWQVGLGAVLVGVAAAVGSPTAGLASRFVAASAAWSLLPLLRTDGAWALADAVGLRNLEAPSPERVVPGRRWAAAAARGAAVVAVTAVGVSVSWRLGVAVVYVWGHSRGAGMGASAAAVAIALLVFVPASRRVAGLLMRIRDDLDREPDPTRGSGTVTHRPRPTTVAELLPRLAEAISAAESLLVPLTEADLARHTGGWTVAQVLEHICVTADMYIARLRPALDEVSDADRPDADPSMRTTLVGRLLAGGVDPRSQRRLRAPGRFAPTPDPRTDIRNHVFRLYTELYGLLQSGASLPLDRKRFATPVSPLLRINAWDAFVVLTLHLERHLDQVRRNLAFSA